MNTLIPVSTGAQARSPDSRAAASIWRDGAILEAIVRGRTAEGLTRLQVGRHLVDARGGEALDDGQRLRLKVAVGRDQVLLKPVREQPATRVRDAVRQTLPRQIGQPPLLANLGYLARTAPPTGRFAPLTELARNLLNTLPDQASVVKPEGLRQAIRESGVFLENRLASRPTTGEPPRLDGDWKAALLKASSTLTRLDGRAAPPTPGPARVSAASPEPAPGRAGSAAAAVDSKHRVAATGDGRVTIKSAPPTAQASSRAPAPATAVVRNPAGGAGFAPFVDGPARTGATAAASGPSAGGVAVRPGNTSPANTGAGPGAESVVRPRDTAAPPLRGGTAAPQPQAPPSIVGLDARGAIAELASQLTGVVSRLTLSQLASLPADAGANNSWVIELPVRNTDGGTDVFEFRFEREPTADEAASAAWSVQLSFDFDSTGPVHARVTVRGDEVTTRFRAQRESTTNLIAGQLDRLRKQFEQRGLAVNCLACQTGEPPRSAAPPGGLVATRA